MPSPSVGPSSAQHATASSSSRLQPQTYLRVRARLAPRLLTQAPPWVRSVFDHAWAPMEALIRQASCLPPALWDHLLDCEGGFILIRPGQSCYAPGPERIGEQLIQNVAFVSVQDLAADNERPLHILGHLIDHHLGCAGRLDAPWLSEGGGAIPAWQQAGARLPGLFALGYGVDEVAQSNVRDYFAQSLAIYCRDRKRLNVSDPQIYKWFRNTLWNAAFWQKR